MVKARNISETGTRSSTVAVAASLFRMRKDSANKKYKTKNVRCAKKNKTRKLNE